MNKKFREIVWKNLEENLVKYVIKHIVTSIYQVKIQQIRYVWKNQKNVIDNELNLIFSIRSK